MKDFFNCVPGYFPLGLFVTNFHFGSESFGNGDANGHAVVRRVLFRFTQDVHYRVVLQVLEETVVQVEEAKGSTNCSKDVVQAVLAKVYLREGTFYSKKRL